MGNGGDTYTGILLNVLAFGPHVHVHTSPLTFAEVGLLFEASDWLTLLQGYGCSSFIRVFVWTEIFFRSKVEKVEVLKMPVYVWTGRVS